MSTPKESKSPLGGAKRSKSEPPAPDSPTKDTRSHQIGSTLDRILAELKDIKLEVRNNSSKMEMMCAEMAGIKSDLQTAAVRITEVESRVSLQEDYTESMKATVRDLKTKVLILEKARTDAEDRNRRLNIRVLGIPENAEMDSCSDFLEELIPEVLKIEFIRPFEIQRAHRIPSRKQRDTTNPRPLIFQVLRAQHIDLIMRAQRILQPIQWKGNRITFTRDYASETVAIRKEFLALRPRLKTLQLRYGLLDPAKMKVTHGTSTKIFLKPSDLKSFLDGLEPPQMES